MEKKHFTLSGLGVHKMTDGKIQDMAEAVALLADAFQELADVLNDLVQNVVDFVVAFFHSPEWKKLSRAFRRFFLPGPQRRPDPVSRARLLSARRHLPNTLAVI